MKSIALSRASLSGNDAETERSARWPGLVIGLSLAASVLWSGSIAYGLYFFIARMAD